MRHLALLTLLAIPLAALADDINLDDIDIDLDDLDLGESGGPASLDYSGSYTDRKQDIKPGSKLTITHTKGPITINCSDGDTLSGRVDFSIEGTDKAKMESVGKNIRIQVWGSGATSGGVKVTVPSFGSGVSSVSTPVTISAPKDAKLAVTGGAYPISLTNCTQDVSVSTAGGVYVEGKFDSFQVSSSKGDVKVELEEGAVISKSSKAASAAGSVTLIMPDNPNNQLVATGNEVAVAPLVTGTNTDTKVSGEMGSGGATITLSAPKGAVALKTH